MACRRWSVPWLRQRPSSSSTSGLGSAIPSARSPTSFRRRQAPTWRSRARKTNAPTRSPMCASTLHGQEHCWAGPLATAFPKGSHACCRWRVEHCRHDWTCPAVRHAMHVSPFLPCLRRPAGYSPDRRHMKVPSPLTDLWLFAAYTAASVIGLLLLKHALPLVRADWQGGSFLTAPVLVLAVGACLYIASFAVWLIILARHELSAAYPTAIGLTLSFSTLAASVFLGEPLSFLRIGGIILIFIGIFFVTRF